MSTLSPKRVLHIDLETYSSVDLEECGVYKYAESRDFEILLFGYSWDDQEEVNVIEHPAQKGLPEEIWKALQDPDVIKVAHNASFERVCLSHFIHLFPDKNNYSTNEVKPFYDNFFLPPEQWLDTQIMAAENGYPASLAKVGKALGLPEDKQKSATGKRLLLYFCKPCKPTRANGGRRRNKDTDDAEKWRLFIEYNRQDVVTEKAIYHKLMAINPVDHVEWKNWDVDQRINDRGIPLDMDLVYKILKKGDVYSEALQKEAKELTGLANPNSLARLKDWLEKTEGYAIKSLNKTAVSDLLDGNLKPETRRVLEIRQNLGKTSVKKYDAFERSACSDGRVRGCFQFYGGRTGRFAGKLIQPQNFPRNSFDDFDYARALVKDEDWTALSCFYPSLNDVFSTLIRTTIQAKDYRTFVVADYSAIEARVIAWLAKEQWRQDTFKNGGDIYCASASQMFHVPVVKHGQNGHLRQKGKIAELALGYGGGIGALKAMGGESMGLTDAEMSEIVMKWRAASPNIVRLWSTFGNAFKKAVRGSVVRLDKEKMMFFRKAGNVYIQLPNGRLLAYVSPEIVDRKICFMGVSQGTKQWQVIDTWGGKITENVIQAIARDCLCETLLKLEECGYNPVMHVHDEVICEVPESIGDKCLEGLKYIMGKSPEWAPDLVLTADGFISKYYKKD